MAGVCGLSSNQNEPVVGFADYADNKKRQQAGVFYV